MAESKGKVSDTTKPESNETSEWPDRILDGVEYGISAGAGIASEFLPVPGLSSVAEIVVKIIDACRQVKVQRKQAQHLGEYCSELREALDEHGNIFKDGTHDTAQKIISLLEEIKTRMTHWASLDFVHSLINQSKIRGDISEAYTNIGQCLKVFHLSAVASQQEWDNKFEEAQKEDNQFLVEILLKTQEGQNEIIKDQHVILSGQSRQEASLAKIQQLLGALPSIPKLGIYQQVIPLCKADDPRRGQLQIDFHDIAQKSGELPPGLILEAGECRRTSEHPVPGGSSVFEVYEGTWMGKEKVAMKSIRSVTATPSNLRRFEREGVIWRQVWEKDRGKYVLPCYGIHKDESPYLVSPWQKNSTILAYVRAYPDEVNRLDLAKGVAEAIQFIHSWTPNPIVHGDIKCDNILISDTGKPLLSDFGFSKILENVTEVPFTQSKSFSDSFRYLAPEMCDDPPVLSPAADIYAFSMTLLEIMTMRKPFPTVKSNTAVLIKVQKGNRPPRPARQEGTPGDINDTLWDLLQTCWKQDPHERPSAKEVISALIHV
ncbi:kinase-like protein [Sistotremastrum suecicum HHB10207 ss-3]|uniref:Kinase-like protein n=1 Tax=Sistotremastrum suecicum HHB10207 ss-3 TaxID=1314776 RepID=A0A166EJP1_9AGAM|nr:kinase-like protein [Sistotremastrum suecicum HHB10207 ss-3]